MSMQDVVMNVLRCVPGPVRETAIRCAMADQTDAAVEHAANKAREAATRLHERLAVRTGAWNGLERRKTERRLVCVDCPHNNPYTRDDVR